PSTVAGASIAADSRVSATITDSDIAYDADASVANLDLQRIGKQFNMKALVEDRYKSDINAHVTAKGRGTKPAEMNVDASGAIRDTTLMGGRIPTLDFTANVADDSAHVTANGSFADFDPAMASGSPKMKGTVGGSLDVDATAAKVSQGVTVDSVQGSARIQL